MRPIIWVGMLFLMFLTSYKPPIALENDGTSSPNFTWAVQYSSFGQTLARTLSLTSEGDIVMAGVEQLYYSDISTFSSGWRDAAFVAIHSATGELRWAKHIQSRLLRSESSLGSSENVAWRGIATDAANNVYAIGQFRDSIAADTFRFVSRGGTDILLAKYSANGVLQWVQTFGGTKNDGGLAITVNNAGAVFITGYFTDSARIGTTQFVANNGSQDAFLSAVGDNGAILWTRICGGNSSDAGFKLIAGKGGNIYLSGVFSNAAVFQPGGEIFSSTYRHPFVAQYTSQGALLWVREVGGLSNDVNLNIFASDNDDNVILVGDFYRQADFDTTRLRPVPNANDTRSDFIVKLTANAKVVWAKRFTNSELNFFAVKTDMQGNIYVGGSYSSAVDLGGTIVGTSQSEQSKVLLLHYAPNGELRTVARSGDVQYGTIVCLDMAIKQNGEVIGTGSLREQAILSRTVLSVPRRGSDSYVAPLFSASFNR